MPAVDHDIHGAYLCQHAFGCTRQPCRVGQVQGDHMHCRASLAQGSRHGFRVASFRADKPRWRRVSPMLRRRLFRCHCWPRLPKQCGCSSVPRVARTGVDVGVLCVVLNELPAWGNVVTQSGEHVVCTGRSQSSPDARSGFQGSRWLQKLLGVHLTKTLVTLDMDAALAPLLPLNSAMRRSRSSSFQA